MKRRRVVSMLHQAMKMAWAMEPSALADISGAMISIAAGGSFDSRGRRVGGESQSSGQIGVLNMFGPLQKRPSVFMDLFGGTSTDVASRVFARLVADTSVSAIVLNCDSPGGTVLGTPEFAAQVYAARGTKPIIAVANGMMASAMYYIASAADEIVMLPSSPGVGSIGVMQILIDESAAMEKAGVKATVITSSKYKAEGNPYEPLTEEAKQHQQNRTNSMHQGFVSAVSLHRGVSVETVEKTFGQGRLLLAHEAVAVGMVDRIGTLEDVLRELGGSTSAGSVVAQSPGTPKGGCSMHPKVKLALVDRGLATVASDDAHCKAALDLFYAAEGKAIPADDTAIVADLKPTAAVASPVPQQGTISHTPGALKAEEIISLVATAGAGLPPEQRLSLQSQLLKGPVTYQSAREQIDAVNIASTPIVGSGTITVTRDATDKLRAEARDALVCRALAGAKLPETIYDRNTREEVAFKPSKSPQLGSLTKLATKVLENAGVPRQKIENLEQSEIARMVCGADPANFGINLSASESHYNVTGMFSNILLDAQNVLLRKSYNDANTTYQLWAKRGESLTDFKAVNKIIAGEIGDPKAIGEDGEFEESTLTDGKESYKLTVWGEIFSVTWQVVVNDRLSAFTEVPMKLTRAMKRKQNRLVYGVLKDNAALADTGALFNGTAVSTPGGHANLTTGTLTTGADYQTAIATMVAKLAVQKGLSTDSGALNLTGRHLIFPPARQNQLATLLASVAVPGGTNNTINIYQGQFHPIMEAELATAFGGSDTAFYLIADSADIDTVEYAYLSGFETPALEMQNSFDTLGMKYRIYQPFAVKALDYRGMQKHAGA